jgi:putative zinc finger/helix-turn-helix YgiT family protein
MPGICPICEDKREIKIVKKSEKSNIRGRTIKADSIYSVCTHCGNEFSSPGQMDTSLTNAYNEYRKLEKVIFPDEIVRIRKKYGASQKAFAKILDLGELAINSLELGSLPPQSMSDLIRLMDKPGNFSRLFYKNKKHLSLTQVKKIESCLEKQSVPLTDENLKLF